MIRITVQVDGRHRKVIFDTVNRRLGVLRFDLNFPDEAEAFGELESVIAPTDFETVQTLGITPD